MCDNATLYENADSWHYTLLVEASECIVQMFQMETGVRLAFTTTEGDPTACQMLVQSFLQDLGYDVNF